MNSRGYTKRYNPNFSGLNGYKAVVDHQSIGPGEALLIPDQSLPSSNGRCWTIPRSRRDIEKGNVRSARQSHVRSVDEGHVRCVYSYLRVLDIRIGTDSHPPTPLKRLTTVRPAPGYLWIFLGI